MSYGAGNALAHSTETASACNLDQHTTAAPMPARHKRLSDYNLYLRHNFSALNIANRSDITDMRTSISERFHGSHRTYLGTLDHNLCSASSYRSAAFMAINRLTFTAII
jgi:hypothetical protein